MKTQLSWALACWGAVGIGALAAPPATPALPALPSAGEIRVDHLNIRGQPTVHSEVVTQLSAGAPVKVLEKIHLKKPKPDDPTNWFRIALPSGVHVWVSSLFVNPSSKTVEVKRLNVRSGPGENYSIVGRLQRGAKVVATGSKGNWLKIEPPPGSYAFVAADFVKLKTATPKPKPPVVASNKTRRPPPAPAKFASTKLPPPITPPAPKRVKPAPSPAPPPAPLPTPSPMPTTEHAEVVPTAPPPAKLASSTEPRSPDMPPKRIVTREGVVTGAISIQAPSSVALETADTSQVIDYLQSEKLGLKLGVLKGRKIRVTGEEFIDQRWPKTPILEVDNLRLIP